MLFIDTAPIVPPILIVEIQKPANKITHKVKKGETLVSIAKRHKTAWKRLYYANKHIKHPDDIRPSQVLIIPQKNEKLKPRRIPRPAIIKVSNVSLNQNSTRNSSPRGSFSSSRPVGSHPGNLYTPGQCTWYVKKLRPDIPNNWGNAWEWLGNARAIGWPTGNTPRVGAIGWTSGHVVVITAVNGSTVSYTDMNGNWVPYEVGYNSAPASKYIYIY